MKYTKFLRTRIFRVFVLLIFIFSFGGNLLAQEARLMPPVPMPQPQFIKAEPQLRIYEASLVPIGPSWAFEFTFEAFTWIGLDEDNKPIEYIIERGTEKIEQKKATKYERYTGSLSGNAYMYLDNDFRKLFNIRVEIPKASEPTTIKLGPIPSDLRILPGAYRIVIEFNLVVQTRRTRDIIWVDRDIITATGSTEIIRVSSQGLPTLRESTIILVGDNKNNRYDFLQSGSVNYYLEALNKIDNIENLKRNIEETIKIYNDGKDERARRLLPVIRRKQLELAESNFFKPKRDEILKLLKEAKENQQKINVYLVEFEKKQAKIADDIATDLQNLYLEMWWVGNLCLPKWTPSADLGTLEELRNKWQISRFINAPLSETEIQGSWKRDDWLEWAQNEWKPKITKLYNKFRLFFGDDKFTNEHKWHFGLDEFSIKTFWEPKKRDVYERMRYLFKENLLEKFADAQANLLGEFHTPSEEEKSYPFVSDDGKKPNPYPRDAVRFFRTIVEIRKKLSNAFAINRAIANLPDITDLPKRKFYVNRESGYVGPNPICPFTGDKCEGPFDESVLNPKDDPDEQ